MRRLGSLLFFMLLLSAAWTTHAADDSTAAVVRRVTASYLFKFGTYITWPDDIFLRPDSPFVIGIVGDERLADELTNIVSKRLVDTHPVIVRKLQRMESLAGIHIVFIGGNDESKVNECLARTRGLPIVSVTERSEAFPEDSVINLMTDQDRVRFDVSLNNAERNRIKLSSALITVARNIVGRRP